MRFKRHPNKPKRGSGGNERVAEKRSNPQIGPPTWLLASMLNGEPLLANTSIHDFQGEVASYITDVMEQALLLPEDMVEL